MPKNSGGAIIDMITSRQGNMYTMIPARVVSYNSETQTCAVELSVKRPYQRDISTEVVSVLDVPVAFYYGDDWVIASTLKQGDAVLLICPMYDIENWLNGDKDKIYDASGYQFHNLDGAFAFPVAFTFNSPTRDPRFKDLFHIVKGSNYITMGDGGVTIESGGTKVEVFNGGNVDVTAPTINLKGNATVSGNLNVTGNIDSGGTVSAPTVSAASSMSVGGKEMSGHTHNYTDDGNSLVTGGNN